MGSVSARETHLLGLTFGAAVVRRALTLAIDGRIVLTSTSVLPPEAAHPTPWHDVEIGALAVPADRSTPDGSIRLSCAEFAPTDRDAFRLTPEDQVAMLIIRHRRQVRIGSTTALGGVIVLARGDLVRTSLPI